MFVDNIALEH